VAGGGNGQVLQDVKEFDPLGGGRGPRCLDRCTCTCIFLLTNREPTFFNII
jgi:hypothetical protein